MNDVIKLTYQGKDRGTQRQDAVNKTFTALVLQFHKPNNLGRKDGEVAVKVRWLDAPPNQGSGVINKENLMSLTPRGWKHWKDYN